MKPDEAALVINLNETWCSACGVAADPLLFDSHRIEEYGCGRVWGAVTSDQPTLKAKVMEARPNLPWIDRADT